MQSRWSHPAHTRGAAPPLAAGTRRHLRLLFSTALCQGAHAAAGALQSVAALTAPCRRLCLKSPRPDQLPPGLPEPFQCRPQLLSLSTCPVMQRTQHQQQRQCARLQFRAPRVHPAPRPPLTVDPAAARAQHSLRALAARGAFGRARAYAPVAGGEWVGSHAPPAP
jgi:hypothetical protein